MDAAFLASLKGPGALRGAPGAADDAKPPAEASAARDEIKREAAAHERLELGSPAASVSSDGGGSDDDVAACAAAKVQHAELADEIGGGDADESRDAAGAAGEPSELERMFELHHSLAAAAQTQQTRRWRGRNREPSGGSCSCSSSSRGSALRAGAGEQGSKPGLRHGRP